MLDLDCFSGRDRRRAKSSLALGGLLDASEMKVMLGTFVYSCLKAQFGPDVARSAVSGALRHYDRRLRSSSRPLPVPTLDCVEPYGGGGVELDLSLDPEVHESLKREALRQAVDLRRLVTHAVFVYLTDMELAAQKGGRKLVPLPLAR